MGAHGDATSLRPALDASINNIHDFYDFYVTAGKGAYRWPSVRT